ncbi:MAG: DUF2442 domain-containing protein [Christensenellaceae bacterium]|jgi:hypothetical protein|nr:DUF2442 domain-containing protein [Christensenellaceae bacterium]
MFHKITSLATHPDYILLAGFDDGEFRQFDLKPLIKKYTPFRSLTEINGLFSNAKIDAGGYGIAWNDDLDISAESVYEQGTAVSAPHDI